MSKGPAPPARGCDGPGPGGVTTPARAAMKIVFTVHPLGIPGDNWPFQRGGPSDEEFPWACAGTRRKGR
jgi:hypothetical protein